jgi:hypothetical protein
MVAALTVAVLVVGGFVTWRVLDRATVTTIPASFDGLWQGMSSGGQKLTATLDKDQQLGNLASGANGCYNGALTVREATNSRLTMRFTPADPGKCNMWTVVVTHASGGGLRMAVDPDNNRYHETEFAVPMTRQG